MSASSPASLSPAERRAGMSLAAIVGLRMFGLFLILPVFAEYARTLPGGDNLTLVGIALGAYGMTQALLQIPFGAASDRLGRKPVIVAGLLIFALGSAVAALAGDIYWTIAGRALQGAGAISAAVMALAADLTREQHRTKVMAMIGSTIGVMFAVSLIAAPRLFASIGMAGIFWTTAALAGGGIALLLASVPHPPALPPAAPVPFGEVLRDTRLLRLNFGIFTLHMTQIAMFVVVPGLLVARGLDLGEHWKVYLPVLLASFAVMVPAIIVAEKHGRIRTVFIAAVALLFVTELALSQSTERLAWLVTALFAYFVAFNVLEATLPSLVSRIAPARAKGAALGVYNTTQALGAATGGALGGLLTKHSGASAVFLMAAAVVAIWLLLAASMPVVGPRTAQAKLV